jgi:hypothetical protein
MPIQDGLWQLAGGDVLLAQSGNAEPAILRAREILRYDRDLTRAQFHELDGLLRTVSHAQFAVLTDDPLHQARLRQYEALSWQNSGLSVLIPAVLIMLGAALSFVVFANPW